MIGASKIYASSLSELITAIENGAGGDDPLADIVSTLLNFALPLSGLCVFLLVAFASYKLMMSKGDPDKLRDAKDQITNAVIGFVFVILSAVILLLLGNILNININSGY